MSLLSGAEIQALLADAAGRAGRYLAGLDERPVAPDGAALAGLALIAAVQQDGTCWCGPTVWQHRPAMRISISGWATTAEDIRQSADAIVAAARVPNPPRT